MSDLYFNEESDYFEGNTSDNEAFRSTILQPFQFEPEQKKTCGNESHEKELQKQSFADILQNRCSLNICEIFKSNFFYRTPPVATSETKHIHASAAS